MAIALFNNETDKVYFNNLLATRKLKDKRNERESYEKEIQSALDSCGEILKTHGARCNFIAEIDKIESEMEPKGILSPTETKEANNYAEQITSLTSELTELLKNIPREISEDLEFFSKQIIDRRSRREETLEKEKEIIDLYPEAESVDIYQVFEALKHIFDGIRSFTGEIDEPVLDNIVDYDQNKVMRQKVKGIKKAPNSLLEKNGLLIEVDFSEELSKPITQTNTGLFDVVDEVFSEDNSQDPSLKEELNEDVVVYIPEKDEEMNNDIKEDYISKIETEPILEEQLPEEEINKTIEEPEEKDIMTSELQEEIPEAEISEIETDINKESTHEELEEEPVTRISEPAAIINNGPVQENKAETETIEDDVITFEMPEDFTLSDLATALCEDPKGWIDLYESNKELFDKIIQDKNNGVFEEIENNKTLFAGLTIKVPTVFNKGQEEKKSLGKVA